MTNSFFKDMHILAVDDEWDVIETIQEILDTAQVDVAKTYETALEKIQATQYDLAILDILGVNGIELLEECVKRNIPAVMLTANAMSPDTLMTSIKKGAISYLSKEHLADLAPILKSLLEARNQGNPTWKILFDKLENDFNMRFGNDWKSADPDFWADFERYWDLSRGIQERLRHNPDIIDKGI
ncbi:MAG: response regulator [Desulfobacterales bacterium]|nr:response regulator [Desulfobacterales bacterium]